MDRAGGSSARTRRGAGVFAGRRPHSARRGRRHLLSAARPAGDAADAVAGCRNEGTFPVLVGEEGAADVMLSSPIILYDHPAVAPESAGDFCDATEIDEILALRVLTLTDDEKAEARGTDRRAAAIVDRCDDMPPEVWARLHGAVRSLRPIEEAPTTAMAPSSLRRCRGGIRASTPRSTRGRTPRGSAGSRSARARRCVSAPPGGRRPRPLPRRPHGHRRGRVQGRRRRRARRRHPGRRPGRRDVRVAATLPVLPSGRSGGATA